MTAQYRPGIRCSKCESRDTVVMETRPLHYGIARRRKCLDCGHRFRTVEMNMAHVPTSQKLDFLFKRKSA